MHAIELLRRVEQHGAHLGVEGGRVYVEPLSAIPPNLYRELKSHKGELLTVLTDLPPEGDPRRVPIEIIDRVWAAGCWLLIVGDHIRAVPRDDAASLEHLAPELLERVEQHQAELLRALTDSE